jgi:DinB superfamily
MKTLGLSVVCVVVLGAGVGAFQAGGRQAGPPPTPPASVAAEVSGFYNTIAGYIARSAELVPADKYTWQPTPEVRSYARMFAHIIDDNNGACSAIAGVTAPTTRVDSGSAGNWAADKMTKADLVKALNDSIALCQKAFSMVDQANMMEMNGRRTKIGSLIYNTSHVNEHYGNLVTYLRLNGMVPPSSAPRGGGFVH